jgi:hypothetical protein
MKKIDVGFILPDSRKSRVDQKPIELKQILKRHIVIQVRIFLLCIQRK